MYRLRPKSTGGYLRPLGERGGITFKSRRREVGIVPVSVVSNENVVEKTHRPPGKLEPDEREVLADAGLEPDAVLEKRYSYRGLLDAGVPDSLSASLRRRLSLPWSFETDGDLDRRSETVRGLDEAERAWIAASADEGWQAFETAGGRASDGETGEEAGERPWPRPTPVTAVTAVGPDDARRLAEAGIISAERLATVDAMSVANALDVRVLQVRTWRHNARELLSE